MHPNNYYILQCFDDYLKIYNDPLKNRPTAKNLITLYTYFHKDAKTSENFLWGENFYYCSDFKAINIFVVYNSNIKKNSIVVLTCVALANWNWKKNIQRLTKNVLWFHLSWIFFPVK